MAFENGRQKAALIYGYDRREFFNFSSRHNYVLFDVLGRPFRRRDWKLTWIPWNFVAMPEEKIADYRSLFREAVPKALRARSLGRLTHQR